MYIYTLSIYMCIYTFTYICKSQRPILFVEARLPLILPVIAPLSFVYLVPDAALREHSVDSLGCFSNLFTLRVFASN